VSTFATRALDPVFKLKEKAEIEDCRHRHGEPMTSVRINSGRKARRPVEKAHVTDTKTGICLEISWASPCGVLFGVPNGMPLREELDRLALSISLKISLPTPRAEDVLLAQSMELLDSFLYELNIRNGILVEPVRIVEHDSEFHRNNQILSINLDFRALPSAGKSLSFFLLLRALEIIPRSRFFHFIKCWNIFPVYRSPECHEESSTGTRGSALQHFLRSRNTEDP
jgi:hypothetical protein